MSGCRSPIGFDGGGFSRWVILVFRGSLWPVEGSLRPVFHCGTWEWGPSHPMMSFLDEGTTSLTWCLRVCVPTRFQRLWEPQNIRKKNKKLVLEPEPRENFGITQKWSLRRMSEFVTVILMHPSQTYYRWRFCHNFHFATWIEITNPSGVMFWGFTFWRRGREKHVIENLSWKSW